MIKNREEGEFLIGLAAAGQQREIPLNAGRAVWL
jgi:hypothetical protein